MDNLFYWVSKLFWLLFSPDSLLLLWLAVALLMMYLGRVVWARRMLLGLLVIFLIVGLFPVGEWLLYPLEKTYPPISSAEEMGGADGVVVLSGPVDAMRSSLWDQVILGSSAERLLAFMALARSYPSAKLIYTGGTGSMFNQEFKAADVAKRLFVEQGLDLSRIVFERESRNTWENAVFSKAKAMPQAGERWVLITTAWHMPRSMGIFCKVGWDMVPYPVDYRTKPGHLFRMDWNFSEHLVDFVTATKEWIGLFAYRTTGKSC
jgi:uncharacterized SAM-binding protein YcdF (DUF218 family)